MAKSKKATDSFSALRKKAEKAIEKDLKPKGKKISGEMDHELKVHKLELEMQNDELRATQQKLQNSLGNFTELFDYAPTSYFILDKKGIIESLNEKALELFGYTRSELTGKHFSKFLHSKISQDNFYLHRMKIMDTGKSDHIECSISCKDGNVIPAIINSSIIKDEKNKFKQFLTMVSDISDRKKAEIELEEAYRSIRNLTEHIQNLKEEERINFTHGIHDELSHQITTVSTGLHWLKKESGIADKKAAKKIDELLTTLKSSMNTVNKMMEKHHSNALDQLGLDTAIEIHLNAFKRWSGIHVNLTLPETEIEMVDPQKIAIFQIFQESLNNVVKHASAKNIDVSLIQHESNIELSVIDDGQGFDEKEIRLKKKFGIQGMKERVLNFDGSFKITSEKGKGTQIHVSMPIHQNMEL